jgi:hypothetical protein
MKYSLLQLIIKCQKCPLFFSRCREKSAYMEQPVMNISLFEYNIKLLLTDCSKSIYSDSESCSKDGSVIYLIYHIDSPLSNTHITWESPRWMAHNNSCSGVDSSSSSYIHHLHSYIHHLSDLELLCIPRVQSLKLVLHSPALWVLTIRSLRPSLSLLSLVVFLVLLQIV